ncbi:acyltransferase [Shimazuella sp. AN120528]|uniref:acyltransferase family protein n=1 Tax=Shimazuella soli TaxID=1892854 RepID=UPI001F1079B1|nr:acyltransferase [Shimazuella soli]MCH5585241.1 acyltransferase [Shimazuella soli]
MNTINNIHIEKSSSQKAGRLFFIDNLRSTLTILVVLHHLVFFSIATNVFKPESIEATIGNLFLSINQSFFMGLFFLISGYFVPSSLERKGAKRFLRDRFIRLFIPIIFYDFILSQTQAIDAYIFNREPLTWKTYFSHITYGPVWFVGVLLIFICLYVFWVKVIRKHTKLTDRQNISLTYTKIIIFVILLAAANFIVRLWVPAFGLPGGSTR